MKNVLLIVFILGISKVSPAQPYLPIAAGLTNSLSGHLYLDPNPANYRYIVLNGADALNGALALQAGGGSSGYGGGLVMFSHSNVTKPGWITAGISAGSGGKFTVNNQGNAGGSDVYTIDASGNSNQAGNFFLQPNSGSYRYLALNGTDALTGALALQAGGGSSGYGGGLVMFSHGHVSKPGWVTAGISAGSGGKFSVNNFGNGLGSDVFSIDVSGNSVQTGNASFGGNVGIGTASPDSKLTVAGKIHSQEVKVTATAGADFVFEEDYKLLSLTETEKFIKQNKHLPEIAPASQMIKEGINLGEMNVKLLQKIEELTLYLIEQNKHIQAQNKRIEKLESCK